MEDNRGSWRGSIWTGGDNTVSRLLGLWHASGVTVIFFQAHLGTISEGEYLNCATCWHGKAGVAVVDQSKIQLLLSKQPCSQEQHGDLVEWEYHLGVLDLVWRTRGASFGRERVWGGAGREKVLELVSFLSVMVWKVTIIWKCSDGHALRLRCPCLRTGIINGSFPVTVNTFPAPAVIYLVQCCSLHRLWYWLPLGFL